MKETNTTYPKRYVAVSKIDGKKIYDHENSGGHLTSYIRQTLGIDIPSLYFRKKYLKENGRQWWEQWFDIIEEDCPDVKKCPYCDWTTVDLDNRSGMFETHLMKVHGISKEEYIISHPEDKAYFNTENRQVQLQIEDDSSKFVTCKVCGKKLSKICNRHLEKHGMTLVEYISKYGDSELICEDTLGKMRDKAKVLNTSKTFTKHSRDENEIKAIIESMGFKCRCDRTILDGNELDIYIEERKLAIEFNGNCWHSEWFGGKDRNYHLDKLERCNSKGVSLIQIFQDEYMYHGDIVIDKIKHALKCNSDLPKVYARKCTLSEISFLESEKFLESNHIQGSVKASVYLGCFHEGELMAVMTFLNEGKGKWNLTRFATDRRFLCVGAGGRLFKYFVRNYNPDEVKSFADRRWTLSVTDNIYVKMGFKLDGIVKPDYMYYSRNSKYGHRRYHKFMFRKERLSRKYGFDMTMTEKEMVMKLGFDRIWNCGLFRFVWKKDGDD